MKLKDVLKIIPHYTIVEIAEGKLVNAPAIARDFPEGNDLKPHYERTVCAVRADEKNHIRVCVYDRRKPVRY